LPELDDDVAESFARAKEFEGVRGNLARVAARSPRRPLCRVALDFAFIEIDETAAMGWVEAGAFKASHRRFTDAKALGHVFACQRIAARLGICRAGHCTASSGARFLGHSTTMVTQLRVASAG
jgi:hypothetical protein